MLPLVQLFLEGFWTGCSRFPIAILSSKPQTDYRYSASYIAWEIAGVVLGRQTMEKDALRFACRLIALVERAWC